MFRSFAEQSIIHIETFPSSRWALIATSRQLRTTVAGPPAASQRAGHVTPARGESRDLCPGADWPADVVRDGSHAGPVRISAISLYTVSAMMEVGVLWVQLSVWWFPSVGGG